PLCSLILITPPPPIYTLFPYTTLFRSAQHITLKYRARLEKLLNLLRRQGRNHSAAICHNGDQPFGSEMTQCLPHGNSADLKFSRSEEHTSELQSLAYLVCRLLLEKKKY